MKQLFWIPVIGILILATACKKDDEPVHNTPPEQHDTSYVIGCYLPSRQLTAITDDDKTQYFTWSEGEMPLLLNMGSEEQIRSIEYDQQNRQIQVNIPTLTLGVAQVMHFHYTEDHLSQIELIEAGGSTLMGASTTYNGNQMTSIHYDEIDQEMVSHYISNFFNSKKGLVENLSISNMQSDYTWKNDDVSTEHFTAIGSTDFAVGELVQTFNLDTSFYRMLIETTGLSEQIPVITPQLMADFVDMVADSICHIGLNIDLYIYYTYDNHSNPLYGFWGWGFLGNTHVLSSHNILSTRYEGLADVNISFNLPTVVPDRYDLSTRIILSLALTYLNTQYPNGFRYNYPIDLERETNNNYTYDQQGWPSCVVDDNHQVTTFTYKQ